MPENTGFYSQEGDTNPPDGTQTAQIASKGVPKSPQSLNRGPQTPSEGEF